MVRTRKNSSYSARKGISLHGFFSMVLHGSPFGSPCVFHSVWTRISDFLEFYLTNFPYFHPTNVLPLNKLLVFPSSLPLPNFRNWFPPQSPRRPRQLVKVCFAVSQFRRRISIADTRTDAPHGQDYRTGEKSTFTREAPTCEASKYPNPCEIKDSGTSHRLPSPWATPPQSRRRPRQGRISPPALLAQPEPLRRRRAARVRPRGHRTYASV